MDMLPGFRAGCHTGQRPYIRLPCQRPQVRRASVATRVLGFRNGSDSDLKQRLSYVRSYVNSRHCRAWAACLFGARSAHPATLPNRSKVRSYAVRGLGVLGRGESACTREERVMELAGKIALVTGAASGSGLGIATAFAQAGAKVMLCDIEEAALSAALEQLRLTNVDVDGAKADVSPKADLAAAAEATTARYGKVHILVNNAGVGGGGPYGTWTEAAWNWTMGVNLMATIWGIEIFGPLIEQHGEGGHIVSTASIAGLISGESNATSPSMALSRCPRACGVNSRPEGLAYRRCVQGSSALKS